MKMQNSSSFKSFIGVKFNWRRFLAIAGALALPLILLMAGNSSGQEIVFSDSFTGDSYFTNTSTLNSSSPWFAAAYETNSDLLDSDTNIDQWENNAVSDVLYTTSYELISSGTWSPTPSIGSGGLDFGLAASSSAQNIEVEALFADDVSNSPVQLGVTNDYIQLMVTFTDVKGILTNSAGGGGYLNLGLFYSLSQFVYDITNDNLDYAVTNLPVAGGMNGTAVSTSSTHATRNAQNWVGYSAQIANTGLSIRVNTRAQQTGAGNNNQDVLLGSSINSTEGYANPGPNISYSGASTVVLANGNQYTAVLTLTATGVDTNNDGLACAISNSISLYAGAGTSGTLLAQYGANETGANFTTNLFDALGIGWYESGTNVASEIDINQITVTAYQHHDIANNSLADEVAVDSNTVPALGVSNAVYIADPDDNIILEDLTDGTGTNTVEMTVAGTGIAGYSGDGGLATNATLNYPSGVAVDASGNLYIADTSNNVIRVVSGGLIGTFAGTGNAGYTGDGGDATNARLNAPYGVGVDTNDTVYIADTGNNVIRKVTQAGIISTVAGNGTAGYTGDWGLATTASLNYPNGVDVDDSGALVISDAGNKVMREVNTNGYIATVVTTVKDLTDDSADDPHTMVTTATNSDGRLELFAVAEDHQLYHNYQTAANGATWSGWISFSSATNFSIFATSAACLDTTGSMILFIVGNDSQMYRFKELTAGNSSSWDGGYCLNGNFSPVARVATGRGANGTLFGFGVSQTNNQLQEICQATAGGGWSSWTNLGGTWDPQSDVAAGQNPDGSLSLLMIGDGNNGVNNDTNVLFEKRQQGPNGAWTSWTSRGGIFSHISFIGLVNYGTGTNAYLQAFIVDNSTNGTHELMQCWKTNSAAGWVDWFILGTNKWRTTYQVPVAIHNQNGQVGVFMVGWDGNLYYNYCDPYLGWLGWTTGTAGLGNIGQPSDASFDQGIGISAGMNLNGKFDVFGVGDDDGNLYQSTQASANGAFSGGWTNFPEILNGAVLQ